MASPLPMSMDSGTYREALEIRRKLAEAEPGAHLPDVADSLEGLGMLFKYTGRAQAAESYCDIADKIEQGKLTPAASEDILV